MTDIGLWFLLGFVLGGGTAGSLVAAYMYDRSARHHRQHIEDIRALRRLILGDET